MWRFIGQERPPFALEPGPAQESVWDYPRPPRMDADERIVRVVADGRTVAETRNAIRVLETGSPPTFYLPPDDVDIRLLAKTDTTTVCEWKGRAVYWQLVSGNLRIPDAAWSYPDPLPGFRPIAGYFSFYPGKADCFVGDEKVQPQPGKFYGGWMTSEIVGPVKGEPGTAHW